MQHQIDKQTVYLWGGKLTPSLRAMGESKFSSLRTSLLCWRSCQVLFSVIIYASLASFKSEFGLALAAVRSLDSDEILKWQRWGSFRFRPQFRSRRRTSESGPTSLASGLALGARERQRGGGRQTLCGYHCRKLRFISAHTLERESVA